MQPCLRVLGWDWDFSLHFTYGSNIPLKRSRRRSTAAGVALNHLGREDMAQIMLTVLGTDSEQSCSIANLLAKQSSSQSYSYRK